MVYLGYIMVNLVNIGISQKKKTYAGWWYTYPSEKYEFVNGFRMTSHIYEMENKSHVPNHQPDILLIVNHY